MALTQRRFDDCLGYQQTVDIHRQTDLADCADDDFETLIERSNKMKSEKNRLDTYTNWPLWSTQRPERLAEAGLYFTGVDDRVQCPYCYGVLKKWENCDIPMVEHRRHFPYCRFIQGEDVGNIPIEHVPERSEPVVQYGEPGQISANKDLTKEEIRLATYLRWPQNMSQTPESLASAGFYHIPCEERPDRVKCAYCNGKLYNWNFGDDPWVEHARCFPKCPYVQLCVGANVIEDLQKETVVSRREPETSSRTSTTATKLDDVTSIMRSEAVQAVLEMGFSQELVRKVVEKNSKEGKKSVSAEEVASAVLEMEEPNLTSASASSNQSVCTNGQLKVLQTTVPSCVKSKSLLTIRNENSRLRDQYLCKVCMENEIRVTFMPCGHLACCGPCSMAMSECPVCRAAITGCVRTYF